MNVSVVIPVFSRQDLLDCALNSLQSEEKSILEIIVIDDASPIAIVINAPQIIRDRVRLLRLNKNTGGSSARQSGIDAARGEFVAFLDSDDVWMPMKLAKQLERFSAPEEMLAVATGWQVVDVERRKTWCRFPIPSADPIDFASGCWFSPGSTILVTRAALVKTGPLDARLRRLEDLDWFLRFSMLGGRLEVVDIVGALIRKSRGQHLAEVRDASEILIKKFSGSVIHSDRKSILRKLKAWLDVEQASAAYIEGQVLLAAFLVCRSLIRMPRLSLHLRPWWRTQKAQLELDESLKLLSAGTPTLDRSSS